MNSERRNCTPDPRKPPRRCGEGAFNCAADSKTGQFFDECDATRYLFRCDTYRTDGRPQICNPFTDAWLKNVVNSTPMNFSNSNTTFHLSNYTASNNTNTTSQQCLCIAGKECYKGRMCEQCQNGYVRTGIKECRYCDAYPIPLFQSIGFVCILLIILTAFIKVTVASAGSSSPAGSMKKIIINFLQLESLALGFPLQWPPMVTSMFSAMGVTSSANSDVFVIECLFPPQLFDALPAVYQKTIIVTVLPIVFMLGCGIAWFFHDHLCAAKVATMEHSQVPQHLYAKHNTHNKEKSRLTQLEMELRDTRKKSGIPEDQLDEMHNGSRDNDTEEDFGYVYRRAIETATKHHIDVDASFKFFTELKNEEEQSENEKREKINGNVNGKAKGKAKPTAEMSTAAFEHMLKEWKYPIKNDALLWSMLKRVDTDGSGWISIAELQAFERTTIDRWILSATVVAYMFCK